MKNVIANFVKHVLSEGLLLELRNAPDASVPQENTYFAKLLNGGWVVYFEDGGGAPKKPTSQSVASLSFYAGSSIKDFECTPDEIQQYEKYVKMGVMKKKEADNEYVSYQYIKKRPGSAAEQFKSKEDIPPKYFVYSVEYSNSDPIIRVDINNRQIDMDYSWNQEMNRRPGGKQGEARRDISYVIPSGSTAFENRYMDFQKLLKHLLQVDKRVKSDFRIVGEEKYRNKTVGDVIGLPREVDVALSNRAGKDSQALVAYHGTSLKRWQQIQKLGLVPNKQGITYVDQIEGWSDKNVYLTFSPVAAENYATRQALWDGTKTAVVLKVTIPDPSKLVADEDALESYFFMPSRDYTLTFKREPFEKTWHGNPAYLYSEKSKEDWRRNKEEYEKLPPITHTMRADSNHHIKNALDITKTHDEHGSAYIVHDDEYKTYVAEAMKSLHSSTKHSLKKGTFGYRGRIPPNMIKLFMTYPLTKFKTNERGKQSLGFEEYQATRKDTQAKAKRYDD